MTEKEHETNNKKRYASTTITLLYMGWWKHTHKGYIYIKREREGGRERHLPNQLVKVK
jgi:hypothetical protein